MKEFERKSIGCGDNTEKEQVKFGRRFPKTEQLVELPFEHQVYDMVDAEGSKGLTIMEVSSFIIILLNYCFSSQVDIMVSSVDM